MLSEGNEKAERGGEEKNHDNLWCIPAEL